MKYKYVTNQTFFISINISLTDTLKYQTELEQYAYVLRMRLKVQWMSPMVVLKEVRIEGNKFKKI